MSMQSQNTRRRIWITIGLIVIIFLLLTYLVDWDQVLFILRLTNWKTMLIGGLILIVGFIFISSRWRFVLPDKPKLLETFHADSIGYMFTVLSPIPGPAVRVVALTQSTKVPISSASPAMIIDLTLGVIMRMVAFIIAIVINLSLSRALFTILIGSVLIVVVLGIVIWVARNPNKFLPAISGILSRIPGMKGDRLEQSIFNLQAGLTTLRSTRSIIIAMLLSIVMWGCFLIFHYLGFVAMPINLVTRDMLILAAAALVILPPSAPAMIGVYQGVLVGFLILFRITDSSTLTAYAILVFAVQLFLWIIFGIWALTRTRLRLGGLIQQSRDVFREDTTSGDEFNFDI